MYDWNRFPPVALTGKQPITQTICYLLRAFFIRFKPFNHFCNSRFFIQSIKEVRIDVFSVTCIGFYGDISTSNNFNNRKFEFCCKLIITLIMCRNSHNCSGSICHQYIIGYPNRHFFIVRSEEHTSELQSRGHLVCRLLLEKKKYKNRYIITTSKLNDKKCKYKLNLVK